jgi:hypothetical protein
MRGWAGYWIASSDLIIYYILFGFEFQLRHMCFLYKHPFLGCFDVEIAVIRRFSEHHHPQPPNFTAHANRLKCLKTLNRRPISQSDWLCRIVDSILQIRGT